MADEPKQESLTEFKKSFAYGSRTDLNFKFLAELSDAEAGRFFQGLLWKLGDTFNDGQFNRIIDHVYEWQFRAYAGEGKWVYEQGPFTPLQKPLSQCRLALISSSGHYVDGEDPEPFGVKNMTQEEAQRRILDFIRSEPTLSAIPVSTPKGKLRVRHGGYDIRAARMDANVVFPYEILLELEDKGYIGELAPSAYSFVGACSQKKLLKHAGPQWVQMLRERQVDVVLLVPA